MYFDTLTNWNVEGPTGHATQRDRVDRLRDCEFLMRALSPLVAKALADTGYDLLVPADHEWLEAAMSGFPGRVLVRAADELVLVAVAEPGMTQRIGLKPAAVVAPPGWPDVGIAQGAMQLYEALRLLHSLQSHPVSALSARVESRLAAVPETERTREVRQRIGQDVFRETLMDLWRGRCAVTGIPFPPQLLRASHAKPWAHASDMERLDPFNGLLLSSHYDAMFDSGLITFSTSGHLIASPRLDDVVRSHFGISSALRLFSLSPGHVPYLEWHRCHIFKRA